MNTEAKQVLSVSSLISIEYFCLDTTRLCSEKGGFLKKQKVDDKTLILEGWALLPDSNRKQTILPNRVLVVYDRTVIGEAPLTISGRDLGRLQDGDISLPSIQCGFRVSLLLDEKFSNLHMFSVVAEAENGDLFMVIPKRSEWVQLELTGRCNLKCPQCPNNSFSSFHDRELTPEDLTLIQPVLDGVTHGCLDGFGEIFMAKHLKTYLNAIHWSKHFLFHTNAQLMNEAKVFLILDNSPPIRQVIVSLDTLDEEKYTRLRVGGTLKRALENTERLISVRNGRGQKSPRVGINLTLMKENADELEDFVRYAATLDGLFELNFLYDAMPLDDNTESRQSGWTFNYEQQKPKHFAKKAVCSIEKAMKLAEKMGVELCITGSLWKSKLMAETDKYGYCGERLPLHTCGCIQNTRMMLADGRMQYCVWQTASMYDWRKTGHVDPRTQPRGKQVREMILSNIVPHECAGAGCPWVGLRPSDEKKTTHDLDASPGGWSGIRVDK